MCVVLEVFEWGEFTVTLEYTPAKSQMNVILEEVRRKTEYETGVQKFLVKFVVIPSERIKYKTRSKLLSTVARFNQKFVVAHVDSSM